MKGPGETAPRLGKALVARGSSSPISAGNSEALSLAGYVHAVTADCTATEGIIHGMPERSKKRYVPPPYNLALVFAGLGEPETCALPVLGKAFEDRDVIRSFTNGTLCGPTRSFRDASPS